MVVLIDSASGCAEPVAESKWRGFGIKDYLRRWHAATRTRTVLKMRPLTLALLLAAIPAAANAQAKPPEKVDFIGSAQSPISASVAIPEGAAWVWTAGTVPSPADRSAPAGSAARYGDTKTQALSALAEIENRLKARGLSMKDVVFLRCYLVADKHKGGVVDYAGWNAAYGEYFNNANNPTKPTRTTLAIAGLANADLLVEIEAVAVYPKS